MTDETNTDPGTTGMAVLNEEDVLRHVMSRIGELGERVTALESARASTGVTRESDPVPSELDIDDCACGHMRGQHHVGFVGACESCDCSSFRPAAPPAPEPAPTVALDIELRASLRRIVAFARFHMECEGCVYPTVLDDDITRIENMADGVSK